MESIEKITEPVFHKLKSDSRSYAKVYWPIRKEFGSTTENSYVCITNNSEYIRPNGSKIQVKSIFEGKFYPMVNYTIDGSDRVCATSLNWFAYNIANS